MILSLSTFSARTVKMMAKRLVIGCEQQEEKTVRDRQHGEERGSGEMKEIRDGWKQMRAGGGKKGGEREKKNMLGNGGLYGAKEPTCWACLLPQRL